MRTEKGECKIEKYKEKMKEKFSFVMAIFSKEKTKRGEHFVENYLHALKTKK